MPLFEYECEECNQLATHLIRDPSEEPERCEDCRSKRIRRVLSAPWVHGVRRVDSRALERPQDWSRCPERFGEAMRELETRTNIKIDSKNLDQTVERLRAARDS